jgi:hypothetical protein
LFALELALDAVEGSCGREGLISGLSPRIERRRRPVNIA